MFNIETIKLPKQSKYSAAEFAEEMVDYQGKMRRIGSGAYASVYSDKKTNYVYKISEDSAYLEFVKMLSKQTKQNPYFPVIHAARLIEDHKYHRGNEVLVVCMERLSRLGNCDFPQGIVETVVESSPNKCKTFCKLFKLDPELSEALYQMSFLCSSKNVRADLHECNIMLRGKQLVFTDPFVNW